MFKNPTIDFNAHFNPLGNSMCSSPEVVLVFLLYEGSTVHMQVTDSSLVFTFSLLTSLFIHPLRQKSGLYAPNSNSCIFTPIENWTHVYMNLFTRNSPYYHLLKYLLFLTHPVFLNCWSNVTCSATINCRRNIYFSLLTLLTNARPR